MSGSENKEKNPDLKSQSQEEVKIYQEYWFLIIIIACVFILFIVIAVIVKKSIPNKVSNDFAIMNQSGGFKLNSIMKMYNH